MGSGGLLCCIIAFALLCFASTITGSEVNTRPEELWLEKQLNSELDPDLVKRLWVHCEVELINVKNIVEELELDATEDKSGFDSEVISKSDLAKEVVQQASILRNPEVKQTLLQCLRRNDFLVSGEDAQSEHWYSKYLELVYTPNDSPRRRQLLQGSSPSPDLSPAPPPAPPPSHTAVSVRPQVPDSPEETDGSNGESSSGESSANVEANKEDSNNRTIIIAVVVTAVVTFSFASLLFYCFRKSLTGSTRKDDRPLLSLSLQDYSVASANRPFSSFGNSINKENFDQSSRYSVENQKISTSLDGNIFRPSNVENKQSFGAIAGGAKILAEDDELPSLKPPPGRLGPAPGLPPLKPPPGRTDLLPPAPRPPMPPAPPPPPTPPAPPRPMHPAPPPPPPLATKGTPTPPPPPVPPPSRGPNSAGPRPPPPGPPPPGPPPPPIPSGIAGPRAPPPPKSGLPRPPPFGAKPLRPLGQSGPAEEPGTPKTKLKPFFWDKVLASGNQSMVWHQIKAGSFQFNEEMIETLFGYAPPEASKINSKVPSPPPPAQYIQIVDCKKGQNLSILLRALNVTTEEVTDALEEGNELPPEFVQTILKMAPTTEEELKLRLYNGDLSRLGPADRFLKKLVDLPFSFKRMESLLFMCTFEEDASMVKESFTTLEAACTELRKSRLFLKLLEAVLKTGNRMNVGTFRGGAQAFKLDTLLKLSDVKGTDGKTTLLHFVVQEIIRSEGVRAARIARESRGISSSEDLTQHSEDHLRSLGLEVVSGLGGELQNVKKAAVLDFDSVAGTVSKLGHERIKARNFLNSEMRTVDPENGFHQALRSFVQNTEEDVMTLLDEEKRIMALVKSTADYFHGNSGKDEGLRLFIVVRDFLVILDKACKEVKALPRQPSKTENKEAAASSAKPSSEPPRQNNDLRQRLFPAIKDRRVEHSSSDEDSS